MARKRARTVECPGCGKVLVLVPVAGKPARVAGLCACRGTMRAMIEMDAQEEAMRETRKPVDEEGTEE